jgi:hypothetical protein
MTGPARPGMSDPHRKIRFMDNAQQNYINHFALCIDASPSMNKHRLIVPEVVDAYVAFLGLRSRQQSQETRLTVYTFNSPGNETCLFYDMDVLRVPSMKGLYQTRGTTALVDCTLLAIGELEQTATLHGLHSFFLAVVSDGQEWSSRHRPQQLSDRIGRLPDNWTTAAFGPDADAVHSLKQCGFPGSNISVWDTESRSGVEEVGAQLREVSDLLMSGRAQGVHGYNRRAGGLFQLRDFSAAEVQASLTPMALGEYVFLNVTERQQIRDLVKSAAGSYQRGRAFYQFMKRETIQDDKEIAVELGGRVYSGAIARSLLGLPDYEVKVSPDHKAGCTIFVQSNSFNRTMIPGTRLLLLR